MDDDVAWLLSSRQGSCLPDIRLFQGLVAARIEGAHLGNVDIFDDADCFFWGKFSRAGGNNDNMGFRPGLDFDSH